MVVGIVAEVSVPEVSVYIPVSGIRLILLSLNLDLLSGIKIRLILNFTLYQPLLHVVDDF